MGLLSLSKQPGFRKKKTGTLCNKVVSWAAGFRAAIYIYGVRTLQIKDLHLRPQNMSRLPRLSFPCSFLHTFPCMLCQVYGKWVIGGLLLRMGSPGRLLVFPVNVRDEMV